MKPLCVGARVLTRAIKAQFGRIVAGHEPLWLPARTLSQIGSSIIKRASYFLPSSPYRAAEQLFEAEHCAAARKHLLRWTCLMGDYKIKKQTKENDGRVLCNLF